MRCFTFAIGTKGIEFKELHSEQSREREELSATLEGVVENLARVWSTTLWDGTIGFWPLSMSCFAVLKQPPSILWRTLL
jgi:hypothetical protein